ncbi:MAG TPA: Mov34/MPN/PAD-1 family protein, partial [Candidatus Lokiarchaeia archaeon]|nr:Mov34/MPN/PAD-1 family protein [Candidatus Lokiarchaeia archaeon]
MVEINPLAWDFIAENARHYTEEVYGWLLGYFADGEPSILGAYDCQEFLEQTLISAIPEPKQFHQLAISLPNGIGVIGMYHSHPAGSNIFHSHIDDNTVLDYITLESNFVSAVTNGKDIQCFMLVDKDTKALKNVTPKLKVPPLPPSTHFRASIDLSFSPESGDINAPLITSKIAEIINQDWDSRRFLESVSNKVLDKKAALSKLIANPRDKSRSVEVDLPALKENNPDQNTGEISLRAAVSVEIFHKKGD